MQVSDCGKLLVIVNIRCTIGFRERTFWQRMCFVILDVEITKEITISEQKKDIDKYEDKGKQSAFRKLFIPVKWSWNRVRKVWGKSAKQQNVVTLAKKAKQ